MTDLLALCKKFFGTTDLYILLGVSREAKSSELKKAYYKLSLEVHPDRVDDSDKETSTQKFQVLGKVYSMLKDDEKRAVYDETGVIDEEDILQENKDWAQYWRILFKKITLTDIDNFANEYKESEEELKDLKQAYLDGNGCIAFIMENVLCATIDDEPRFEAIIEDLIKNEEVPSLPMWKKEAKRQQKSRKRKAAKEASEAEQLKKELGLGDSEDSLMQMIAQKNQQRAAQMDSFFDTLAAKYAPSKTKGKKSK